MNLDRQARSHGEGQGRNVEIPDQPLADRLRIAWDRPAVRWLVVLLAAVVALALWQTKSGLVTQEDEGTSGIIELASGSEPPDPNAGATIGLATGATAGATSQATVMVYVTGKVKNPGVVTLPAGSRVIDALNAAGGTTRAKPRVNMARVLIDGEQIDPSKPQEFDAIAGSSSSGGSTSSGSSADTGRTRSAEVKINLNTASSDQLQELPRVGPATADKIIAHREASGPFTSVSQLTDIPGIGDKTMESLAPLVTV